MTEEQEQWMEMLSEVRQLRDDRNIAVDKGIEETVAILRLLGFETTSSCQGHIGRIGGGPCVHFGSRSAKQKMAENKTQKERVDDPDYRVLREEAVRLTLIEMERMLRLIVNFYENRQVSMEHRLIVKFFPPAYNILQCQGAELVFLDRNRDKLKRNRAEMEAFTKYLKELFLRGETPLTG